MTRIKSLAAIAIASLLLAACSTTSSSTSSVTSTVPSATTSVGASPVDVTAYADSVCTSISTWEQSLTDGSQTFQDSMGGTPTPQDVKDSLEAYLTSVVDDTQTMLDEIQALGPPPGAEEASAAMVTALTDVKTLFEGVLSSVQSLDTTNPASMESALTDLVPQLQQGAQDVADALSALPEGDLKTALQTNPNCKG